MVPTVGGEGAGAPAREYESRRQERQRRADALNLRERILGNARVVAFVVAVVVGVIGLTTTWYHPAWVAVPLAAFMALLFLHEPALRSLIRARRAVALYAAGLARLADDWRGKGQTGARYADENHPYAADLDLFGKGSLFELLCTARTRTGEDTLARWLLRGAGPDEVRARQAAVAELRPQLDLREDLGLLGSDVASGVDFDGVAAWGAAPVVLKEQWPRWVAFVLGVGGLTCFFGWALTLFGLLGPESAFGDFFHRWGSLPLVVMIVVELAFAGWLFRRVHRVLSTVERRGHDLAMLASVLARLEEATFTSPLLVKLHAELAEGDGSGAPPSGRIAQLSNLIDLLNSRRNQFAAPFAYLFLWGTQMAHAIERWRGVSGPAIGRWLAVVGQFEALCALAAYAFESPDDPFPEVVEGPAVYEGEALAHPLLPRGKCVPNDLRLGAPMRVLIVSGSNMSGKSTFLRTVGINAVLALAGAPVRARRLRLSPLAIGATLRIQDSLQEGRSRFFAEVLRVRQVVDLSRGGVPLLFLLDEIFAGTNSHDRCQGAEAIVRGLVAAGAVGLVTTHDLTLTRIADELGERSANVHFADHFEEGQMRFDYRLHEGVVRHSNALALMRAVGLEV